MLHLNFTPFPTIITERLVLRQMLLEDANDVFFLRSNKQVLQFINRTPTTSIEQATQWIEKITLGQNSNALINWAITLKGESKMIGNICLWNIQPENNKAELGYALHPNFHGKGIMQEAVEKVLQFGYTEMNLDLIDAYTSPNNAASIRLLERNKFIREEVIMEEDDDGNKTWPNAIYVLKNPR